MTEAQRALAAKYVPLARKLAAPLKRAWPTAWEDLDSAACMALVEAAGAFDPAFNVKFTTFARRRILGALADVHRKMAIQHMRREEGTLPRLEPLQADSEEHGRMLGAEPQPEPGTIVSSIDAVENWLCKVPPQHAQVCRLLYIEGKSQFDAAIAMNCSQSRLSVIHREALSMLNHSWDIKAMARLREQERKANRAELAEAFAAED